MTSCETDILNEFKTEIKFDFSGKGLLKDHV